MGWRFLLRRSMVPNATLVVREIGNVVFGVVYAPVHDKIESGNASVVLGTIECRIRVRGGWLTATPSRTGLGKCGFTPQRGSHPYARPPDRLPPKAASHASHPTLDAGARKG